MSLPTIDETPAREVARLASRLKKHVGNSDPALSTMTLGEIWRDLLALPVEDVALRLDMLLGFLQATQDSSEALAASSKVEPEEREEGLLGLRLMSNLLDPSSYGTLTCEEIRLIVSQEALLPRLQLAANVLGSALGHDDEHSLQPEKLAECTVMMESLVEMFQQDHVHQNLKQLAFNFSRTCRHVMENADLYGRVGINKTINRAVDGLLTWNQIFGVRTNGDAEAVSLIIKVIGKVVAVLELEGHRGFSLSTLFLLNAARVAPPGDDMVIKVGELNPQLAHLAGFLKRQ